MDVRCEHKTDTRGNVADFIPSSVPEHGSGVEAPPPLELFTCVFARFRVGCVRAVCLDMSLVQNLRRGVVFELEPAGIH